MNKFKILFLTAILLLISSVPALAADINVAVNGKLVSFPDQKPYVDSANRTMVPVRFPAETLGANVEWLQDTRQVHITNKAHDALKDTDIMATIGRKDVVVNGKTEYMDTTPVITNSRTMVPVRFISEYLGAVVTWDNANRVAHVFSQGQTEAEQKALMEKIAEELKKQQPVPGQPKYIGTLPVPGNPNYSVRQYEATLPLTMADGTTILSIRKGRYIIPRCDAIIVTADKEPSSKGAPSLYFEGRRLGVSGNADLNSDWKPVNGKYEAHYPLKDIGDNPCLDIDPSQPEKIGVRVSNEGIYWISNPL